MIDDNKITLWRLPETLNIEHPSLIVSEPSDSGEWITSWWGKIARRMLHCSLYTRLLFKIHSILISLWCGKGTETIVILDEDNFGDVDSYATCPLLQTLPLILFGSIRDQGKHWSSWRSKQEIAFFLPLNHEYRGRDISARHLERHWSFPYNHLGDRHHLDNQLPVAHGISWYIMLMITKHQDNNLRPPWGKMDTSSLLRVELCLFAGILVIASPPNQGDFSFIYHIPHIWEYMRIYSYVS